MARNLGIVGYGMIGKALAQGLIRSGTPANTLNILVAREESVNKAASELSLKASTDPRILSDCDIVFLSVRSRQALQTAKGIMPSLKVDVGLVSLCSGVPTEAFRSFLHSSVFLIKAITNLNAQTRDGYTVLFSDNRTHPLFSDVCDLFQRVGVVLKADTERDCDVISTFSGTLPGFVALILDALTDAGIHCGVRRELAGPIAAEVMAATARSIVASGLHAQAFKQNVTSPGGVVSKGTQLLESRAIRAALTDALSVVQDAVDVTTNRLVSTDSVTEEQLGQGKENPSGNVKY